MLYSIFRRGGKPIFEPAWKDPIFLWWWHIGEICTYDIILGFYWVISCSKMRSFWLIWWKCREKWDSNTPKNIMLFILYVNKIIIYMRCRKCLLNFKRFQQLPNYNYIQMIMNLTFNCLSTLFVGLINFIIYITHSYFVMP